VIQRQRRLIYTGLESGVIRRLPQSILDQLGPSLSDTLGLDSSSPDFIAVVIGAALVIGVVVLVILF
jgi:hypothetical protein